jgi:hypothetical protein
MKIQNKHKKIIKFNLQIFINIGIVLPSFISPFNSNNKCFYHIGTMHFEKENIGRSN